jgi:branched-chain amino acid transport system substrate-binding protein
MCTRSLAKIGRLLSLFAVAILACTGIGACAQPSSGTTAQNQSPIKIGASIPLTGDFSADGKAVKQGYQLWADGVNKHGGLLGRQVQLDLLNDNSDAKQVTINYQKLITVDKVDLVMGPMGPDTSVAGLLVAARYGYAYIEGVGGTKLIFDTVAQDKLNNHFAVSLPVPKYMAGFANYLLSLPQNVQPQTAAYVGADDPFASQQLEQVKGMLQAGGIRTLLDKTYPAETTDYTPYAQQIIAAKADIVVLGSTATSDCVSFIKTFKQQKYDPKAFIASNGPDQGDAFTQAIGGAQYAEGVFVPNGSWASDSKTFQNAQFVSSYIAQFGGKAVDVGETTAEAFSVGQVLEQAVTKIHSLDNSKLITELHRDSFSTVQGPAKFAADGENTLAVANLYQWQNGQLLSVYPASSAKAHSQYPKAPTW